MIDAEYVIQLKLNATSLWNSAPDNDWSTNPVKHLETASTHLISEKLLYLRQRHGSVVWTQSERNRQTDKSLSIFNCCHQMPKMQMQRSISLFGRNVIQSSVCTSRWGGCRLCGPWESGWTSSETACSPPSHCSSHTPTADMETVRLKRMEETLLHIQHHPTPDFINIPACNGVSVETGRAAWRQVGWAVIFRTKLLGEYTGGTQPHAFLLTLCFFYTHTYAWKHTFKGKLVKSWHEPKHTELEN